MYESLPRQIGEYGRGRKPVNISVPETICEIEKGCHPCSIGLSKTGRPKLIDANSDKTYVAIDTIQSEIGDSPGCKRW